MAARSTAESAEAPNQMGMWGFWTGFGFMETFSRFQKLFWKSTLGSAHSLADQGDGIFEAGNPVGGVESEGRVGFTVPAYSHPQDEPTSRDLVQARRYLGHIHGIVVGKDDDGDAELDGRVQEAAKARRVKGSRLGLVAKTPCWVQTLSYPSCSTRVRCSRMRPRSVGPGGNIWGTAMPTVSAVSYY